MTKLTALARNTYLMFLASIGILAAWFALISTNSCTLGWIHQPKMPASLIKRD